VRAKRREEWQIPDPKELDAEGVRRVRDQIRAHISELLQGNG
jgi:protein-tyrosine-phosphatase